MLKEDVDMVLREFVRYLRSMGIRASEELWKEGTAFIIDREASLEIYFQKCEYRYGHSYGYVNSDKTIFLLNGILDIELEVINEGEYITSNLFEIYHGDIEDMEYKYDEKDGTIRLNIYLCGSNYLSFVVRVFKQIL